jgi:hypothetical protein
LRRRSARNFGRSDALWRARHRSHNRQRRNTGLLQSLHGKRPDTRRTPCRGRIPLRFGNPFRNAVGKR